MKTRTWEWVVIAVIAMALLYLGIAGLVEKARVSDDLHRLETTLCLRIHQDIRNAEFTRDTARQPPTVRTFAEELIPGLKQELELVGCS